MPELAVDGAGLPTLLSVLAGAERERIAAEEIERSCPLSFRPFADELRREIGPIYGLAARSAD